MPSDHKQINTILDLNVKPFKQAKCSWNFRKVEWVKFTKNLEDICANNPFSDGINNMVKIFGISLQKASKMAIPRGKCKGSWVPFWRDYNTDTMISERDRINDGLKIDNTEVLRHKLSKLTHKIEHESRKC